MHLNKFTNKFKIALQEAQLIALNFNNQFIEPVHLMNSFLKDKKIILLLEKCNINVFILKNKIEQEILSLPTVEGKNINIFPSSELLKILNFCKQLSINHGDDFISSEMFILAVFEYNNVISNLITLSGTNINKEKILQEIIKNRKGKKVKSVNDGDESKYLKKYTVDLTSLAEKGKLDPVIGRDEEIRRTIQVLQRRTKNNPVLIGNPGVGKTAIVEGLAQRIINNEVPEGLKNKRLLSLDIGLLIAGTKYRGEFEERIKRLLNYLSKDNHNIILFIDELHNMVGAGKVEGAMDASNMLKPALARGELHCVGATTFNEYRQYIEKDSALERRFQKIYILEPNVTDTIAILRGLKEKYEIHHHVQINDSAIVAAANLSNRYIADRNLPDKAIDLIDEAASNIRIQIDSKPELLDRLERRIIQLKLEIKVVKKDADISSLKKLEVLENELKKREIYFLQLEKEWKKEKLFIVKIQKIKSSLEQYKILLEKARRQNNLEQMSELQYGKIPSLEKKLLNTTMHEKTNKSLLRNCVTENEISDVLSRWTGIPVSKIISSEKDKLLKMENYLHNRIVGQNEAINAVSNAIRRNRSGLSDPNCPIGSFLFLGPTGVGKTELCKALANFLFDSDESIIRIDMSEFMEKHSVSRLLGAPPGYIGYETGGYLTEKIKKRPYSVILLDEVEKAHPDIFNILLQLLSDGRLTDSKGNTVNFRNTIIVMTSNLGSSVIQEKFYNTNYNEMKNLVMNIVNNFFRPEFINRIDEIIVFHPLNENHVNLIIAIQLDNLKKRLNTLEYNINFSEEVIMFISKNEYNKSYGARPIKRIIQQKIENPLAKKILSENLVKEKIINIIIKKEEIFICQ